MPKRTFVAFVIEPELKEGLETVKERDGIPVAVQVRRAIRAWLKTKRVLKRKEGKPKR